MWWLFSIEVIIQCIQGVQVYNADFFPKKHVKFGRMKKRALFIVCSIAFYRFLPTFKANLEYHASTNLHFLM